MRVVTVRAQVAAWLSRVPAVGEPGLSVTVLRFDQRRVRLVLHAGSSDPGGSGWTHGAAVSGREVHRLAAAFNGGFRLSTGTGGFVANGHVAVPLQANAASIVTYKNGRTSIGAWGVEVPARRRPIASVRQNLRLLIDKGQAAGTVDTCGAACWGATLGGGSDVARAGLGITAGGRLLWAAGERLSVRALADALLRAGARRAVELDINPQWVAGYLYVHRPGHAVKPVAMVPGQNGIPGSFLSPYSRDFFTIVAPR
jgi:hypothetical protein